LIPLRINLQSLSPSNGNITFPQEASGKMTFMKQAKVLDDAELKRVLAVAGQGKHAARNRMALLLSHYAGLRVGEIATLRWFDVIGTDGEIKQQFYLKPEHTKSNEARPVHINKRLQRELAIFKSCVTQQLRLADPLIPSQKRGGFSANSLCQLFGRLYREAGIDGATSHSGRRWFITRLAHSGVSPKVIMTLAGHRSLATTQRYIDVNDEMMARAVEIL
jgi:integrase/recombinase XerD